MSGTRVPANREPRCEKTEMLVRDCSHCRGHDDFHEGDWPADPPFPARYGGRCERCDHGFAEGDSIRRLQDEPGYIHNRCPRR
jgi:hypothetical protein